MSETDLAKSLFQEGVRLEKTGKTKTTVFICLHGEFC
jgi:hypothetical protein